MTIIFSVIAIYFYVLL